MHLHIISKKIAKEIGLKYYFIGVPCKNGHLVERYASNSACLACEASDEKKKKLKNWREKSKEHIEKYERDNKEMLSKRFKKYREKNKEKLKIEIKEWRKKNSEYVVEYRKKYYEENKEKIKEKRKQNYEQSRCIVRNRRAKIKKSEGTHSRKDIEKILFLQKNKCASCGTDVKKNYHVDHIMPIALGGGNGPDNLQILCKSCNLKKNSKHPIDWAQQNGRLL